MAEEDEDDVNSKMIENSSNEEPQFLGDQLSVKGDFKISGNLKDMDFLGSVDKEGHLSPLFQSNTDRPLQLALVDQLEEGGPLINGLSYATKMRPDLRRKKRLD